ncbi:MAG: Inositol 2-dehydrogenase/D-chiro-inositol 3-dehydrogenase [Holosporales bacterium]
MGHINFITMEGQMVRIGILSTARINHLGIIWPSKKRNDVTIAGIASKSINSGSAFAKNEGIETVFNSYDDLISSKDIDVVYISLPNVYHFDYVKKCILAKKHVLCEKPICITYNQLIELCDLAIKNNVLIMEAIHYHYYPSLIKIVDCVKAEFKQIDKIKLFLGFPKPLNNDIRLNKSLEGGALNHLGCYLFHFLTWIFPNTDFKKTYIDQSIFQDVDIKTHAIFTTKTPHPTECEIIVSYEHPNIDSYAYIENKDITITIKNALTPTSFYNQECPHQNLLSIETNHPSFQNIQIDNQRNWTTYDYQLEFFIKCLNDQAFAPQVYLDAYKLKSTLGE